MYFLRFSIRNYYFKFKCFLRFSIPNQMDDLLKNILTRNLYPREKRRFALYNILPRDAVKEPTSINLHRVLTYTYRCSLDTFLDLNHRHQSIVLDVLEYQSSHCMFQFCKNFHVILIFKSAFLEHW
jgi:hypothetical protein